jgi:hypothetical protein
MNITELIAKLEQAKNEYGDIKVCYHDNSDETSLEIDRLVPCHPYKKMGEWVEDKNQPPYCIEIN